MAKGKNTNSRGATKTQPRTPQQRVMVLRNGRKLRLRWREWDA